mmetsp:Transcript_131530/g.262462  ORF Transcript_131530/g.262462 Transcript_131530/m.262462 type:complete len:151 (+) Transcript_131530:73-525(+)
MSAHRTSCREGLEPHTSPEKLQARARAPSLAHMSPSSCAQHKSKLLTTSSMGANKTVVCHVDAPHSTQGSSLRLLKVAHPNKSIYCNKSKWLLMDQANPPHIRCCSAKSVKHASASWTEHSLNGSSKMLSLVWQVVGNDLSSNAVGFLKP